MASAANESDSYVPDDDSNILSDSEEDERPNRWHGPRTTWRGFNSEEIATATALKEIQDRDLSVHLYNAFALKQRYRGAKEGVALDGPVAGKDINAATGELVQPDDWLPQRLWTAWPMRADKVPSLQDSRMNDPDERFTLRKRVREMPSTALEEIISGEILKTARQKFNARPWTKASAPGEEADGESEEGDEDEDDGSDVETMASTSASGLSKSRSRSRSRSRTVKSEATIGDGKMGVDEHLPSSKPQEDDDEKPRLKPAVSTDDDLSYNLLRPSVRHILTQLDATLMVLHNVQESTLNYQSDSSNSEASDSSRRSSRSRGRTSRPRSRTPTADGVKRGRGRPPGSRNQSRARSKSRGPTPLVTEDEGEQPKKRPGRPKKSYPRLDGETDKEYTIRIARIRKQALPIFSDSEVDPNPTSETDNPEKRRRANSIDSGNSGDGEQTAGPSTRRRKRKPPLSHPHSTSTSNQGKAPRRASSASTTTSRNSRTSKSGRATEKRTRIGLRDWRDVLGAAALAGFPPATLDRAARRCADLFVGRVGLVTLSEGPAATHARKGVLGREVVYVPGMGYPALVDLGEGGVGGEGDRGEGGGEGGGGGQMSIPMRSRAGSAAPSAIAISEDEAGPSETRVRSHSVSRPRARSRSRSVSAVSGPYVCSIKDCPRAADGEGFARKQNLLRHLKLVHGLTGTSTSAPGSGSEGLGEEMAEEEVDSEDEMYGAVHVDGFLKPIRMRSGWRAADSGARTRRSGYGSGSAKGRGRNRGRGKGKGRDGSEADDDGEDDGDGDVRMGGSGLDE
ncbi:uncharacterized protein GGS22DRAFT_192350 [Annulohypoxylon maeteangense]|uniref:uncharacterized protein n=1 Tax=Annulohypoxylon maeteangense TaxID=1927788 RepID=UPI002008A85F|nr:uncharacterized protein GGS22DRAFT_192350 [Annulohypoxylon maeteangense]KAI0881263.1 hypothetical protein GGS22DRAFT_192350 [Annulohypoxylon maeteangense]